MTERRKVMLLSSEEYFFWLLGIWRNLILRGKRVRSKVYVSPWFQGGAVDEKAQFPEKENFIGQVETRPWFKVSPRLWMICVALVEYEVRNRHLRVIHLT